jgi:hypothetical protein
MALAVLAMVVVVTVPMVKLTAREGSSLDVTTRYTAEAGADDAIGRLLNGDFDGVLIALGDSTSYETDYEINGETVDIQITKGYGVIAREEFETGNWSGGTGWDGPWTDTGLSSVTTTGDPYEGIHHALLNGATDRIERSVDISNAQGYEILVQFWANAKSFHNDDTVEFLISPDGSSWETAEQWVNGDDDSQYRFYSVDVPSSYTNTLHIAWQANTDGGSSYFYIDRILVLKTKFQDSGEVPFDDFESGDWEGGVYWSAPWEENGKTKNTPSNGPYEGSRHGEIDGPAGSYLRRTANLSRLSAAKLQFWGKSTHLDVGDYVDCSIDNGTDVYSLITWTVDDDDLDYTFVSVDIPLEALTATAEISFDSLLSSASEAFNFDFIKIVGRTMVYEIIATVNGVTTTAIASISDDGDVTILHWQTA